jgi:hypothetical protein
MEVQPHPHRVPTYQADDLLWLKRHLPASRSVALAFLPSGPFLTLFWFLRHSARFKFLLYAPGLSAILGKKVAPMK